MGGGGGGGKDQLVSFFTHTSPQPPTPSSTFWVFVDFTTKVYPRPFSASTYLYISRRECHTDKKKEKSMISCPWWKVVGMEVVGRGKQCHTYKKKRTSGEETNRSISSPRGKKPTSPFLQRGRNQTICFFPRGKIWKGEETDSYTCNPAPPLSKIKLWYFNKWIHSKCVISFLKKNSQAGQNIMGQVKILQ